MLYGNPHASTVVSQTAQLWQLTPTFCGSEKEKELNVPIFTQLPYAFDVIQSLTKEKIYLRQPGKRCG
jgi:hypothetical protein